ncbi:tryptophan synthase subunit alpha [uncultured Aquimonas sp.]|uniref:tryptophan synthase subunit alpha n=1 Tax=uncultured Aquimonas sp. TaxID=385483 RepID=UPI000868E99E|nr:tryptophan synthase subunit alpha [uncultured Aquimonas sp.]ODU45256.1 MAG: tryptophan synthase subunit alpha [Xanthomonadaceae bacterium SCN 69-123]
MPTRIDTRLDQLAAAKRTGLIPFITAGDPSDAATVPVMHALVRAGADVIELGVPFSDPMADGPVIQQSSERALSRKVGLRRVLAMVAEFRLQDADTPIVLMGYLNPVEMFGLEAFSKAAREAGVDGVLLVDCPPEESAPVREALNAENLALVPLAAPTSAGERLTTLAQSAQGYLYYVSFAGVTGAGKLDTAEVKQKVAAIRALTANRIAVGFGVRDADSARAIAEFADAVVIGSALVSTLAEATDTAEACARAEAFLKPIRAALG